MNPEYRPPPKRRKVAAPEVPSPSVESLRKKTNKLRKAHVGGVILNYFFAICWSSIANSYFHCTHHIVVPAHTDNPFTEHCTFTSTHLNHSSIEHILQSVPSTQSAPAQMSKGIANFEVFNDIYVYDDTLANLPQQV